MYLFKMIITLLGTNLPCKHKKGSLENILKEKDKKAKGPKKVALNIYIHKI